jgi:glycosyltransferase involved in cell wall biosynthesis
VRLLGLRDDVPDLLRALDLFVMTSLWEGLPRVVPQALATGVPVASYDTAGTREIVREGANGHLVPPGDVGALAEVVRDLVQNDECRRELATRAVRDFDRSFSEDEMIRGLESLYDELCESRLR